MQRFWLHTLGCLTTTAIMFLWMFSGSAAAPVWAQDSTTGAVVGQVRGPDDQPLAEIKVTAINTRNQARSTRITDSKGNYSFEFLMPGIYNIEAGGLPKYPNVVITDIVTTHPKTKTIPLPHITLGRVLLTIRIIDQTGRGVHAVVIAGGDSDRFEERSGINGEVRFLYLRDGAYKIDIYIGGRLVITSYFTARFRSNQQYQLPPYIHRSPGSASNIFELKGDLLAAIDGAIGGEGRHDNPVVGDNADAHSSTDDNGTPPAPRAVSGAERIASFPDEIRQTSDGTALTLGRATIFRQKAAPSGDATPAPQTAASSSVATGPAKVLLANTISVARGSDFTERQIQGLPLGGGTEMRTYDQLVILAPGVAPPPYTFEPRGPGVGFGVNTAGEFSVNGARARANNFTVDGSDNNDPDVGGRRQGFVATAPQSLDSIKGFSISTLLWNAELGRNLGSQVNAVSRYGEDAWHAQAYAFFTDSRLNARNFFDYTGDKDKLTRTQRGFTVGGPFVRSRTHFFGGFEYLDTTALNEQHFSTPTAAERRFLGRPRNVSFGVLPFTGDANRQDLRFSTDEDGTLVGGQILSFYPEPTSNQRGPYGQNTFTKELPADSSGVISSVKVTHQFDDNHLLNARYNFTDDERILPSVNRAIRSTINAEARTQNLSLISDSPLGERRFFQARFSYGRTRLGFSEFPGNPFNFSKTETGRITGLRDPVTATTGQLGGLIVEPFSPVGVDVFTVPQGRVNNTFQFSGAVAYSVGSHSLRFGGEILRFHFDSFQDRNYRPLAVFGYAIQVDGRLIDRAGQPQFFFERTPQSKEQIISGAQLASLGVASASFQTLTSGPPNSAIDLRYTQYSFFANDNWRVSRSFTFDYGLRYEYSGVPSEANDRIEGALRLDGLPSPACPANSIPTTPTEKFNAAVCEYKSVLAGRTHIYDPDRNNFAPHAGFAWSPNNKTAIRSGYGVYYGVILGALVSQSRNVFPNEIPVNVDPLFLRFNVFNLNNTSLLQKPACSPPPGSISSLPNPFCLIESNNQLVSGNFTALVGELFLRNRAGGGLAFTLPKKNLPTPYSQQWHLTAERELLDGYLLSAAYVGTKGTKLTRLITPNNGPYGTAYIPVGPNPPFTNFRLVATNARDNATNEQIELARQPERPMRNLGAYQIFENSAASSYHGLQLEMNKRFERGPVFTAAYTWSHAIDDVSDIFPVAGAPSLPQSANLEGERGSANFDIRHRFASSLVWDLPYYRNQKGWKGRWIGGWQVASIFQAYTGQPFTLHVPFDVNGDGNLTDRPGTTNGLIFCDITPTLPNCDGRRQRLALADGIGVSEFVPRDGGGRVVKQDGAVGRNTVRGEGFVVWDFALNKKFRFNECHLLEFRAEFFNLANRANFGLPIRTIGSPGFGSAVETVTPARIIQFALKYNFGGVPNQ